MRTFAWPVRVAAVALLALGLAGRASGDGPLSTQDLVRFLQAGISEKTVLAELQSRGFAEPLDIEREGALRRAGASETLVVAVRRAAPAAAASPAPSSPSGALAASGAAGAPPPPRAGGGLTFKAGARSVRVPVSVLDKKGQPVLGLTQADFSLEEEGHAQPLSYFSGERKPLRLVLALDVSGSMRDKMDEVSAALQHFINLLEPSDQVMVITFSSDVHIEQEFTSDRDQLENVFARLQPAMGTALFDAGIEAIRRVAEGPAESKAVVLVTDGVDTSSRQSFGTLRELARRSEVPVFSIGIDGGQRTVFSRPTFTGGGRSPGRGGFGGRFPGGGGGGRGGGFPGSGGGGFGGRDAGFDARPLLDLAEDTGGRAEILKITDYETKTAGLKAAVETIAVTLRHRYLVGYEPEPGKKGWRKISVDVAKPSVKVQARKGYYTEG
jgi:VWFA-related protein